MSRDNKLLIENTKSFIKEEEPKQKKSSFDPEPLVPLAMKWLKKKFGDEFVFKHKQNLSEIGKTYYASIDGKEFGISGKLFDTNQDGSGDTVLFKIDPMEDEEETEAPFGE